MRAGLLINVMKETETTAMSMRAAMGIGSEMLESSL